MTLEHPKGPQAALIGFAVRFRGIVVALACLLVAYGVLSLQRAEYGVYPEFAPPQVGIQTEAPGLTPEQIEVLVTQPIENAINGVPGVQSLRSTSIQGLSVITVIFAPGSDIYRDRQVVAERLAVAAQQLPAGTGPPGMTPLASSTSTILVAGLTSDTHSLMDLRTIADWTLRLRLLAVPGVDTNVPLWILGSSHYSAHLAGMLGLQLADRAFNFSRNQRGVGADRLQRARDDPFGLGPPCRREGAFLWLYKIVAGLLIVVVLGIHFVVNHMVAPGGLLSYADVIRYFQNPWVVAMEIAFLVFVVSHSLIGLRSILLDLNPSQAVLKTANAVLLILGAGAILYGIWLALTIANQTPVG